MSAPLVLSLFPGIGLLDMAFEEAGFCVVRGPDLLWGGDVRRFHPPAGRFDGVIGGPPCQLFSALRRLNPKAGSKHGNMIPEYERVVAEAAPAWFVMENVPDAPLPVVPGFAVEPHTFRDAWVGGQTTRIRTFSFGSRDGRRLRIEYAALHTAEPSQAVTGGARRVPVALGGSGKVKRTKIEGVSRVGPGRGQMLTRAEMLEQQGAPPGWLDECPFTDSAARKMVGNGVPLPMGRAVANAVVRAMHPELARGAA
jgi:DNA (cytosine-5)-methyltransferase 1